VTSEQAVAFRLWLGSVIWEARNGMMTAKTLRESLRKIDDTFGTDTEKWIWIDSDGNLHLPR